MNNKSLIELESIEEQVVVLKDNEIYRYGDVVNNVDKICQVIRTKDIYKGSILRTWLDEMNTKRFKDSQSNNTIIRMKKIELLYEKMKEYAERNVINTKKSVNTIVIHLRGGDDFENRGLGNKNILQKIHQDILDESKNIIIEKIIIVTALHYGVAIDSDLYKHKKHKYHFSIKNKNDNLVSIQNFINSLDYPVEIISSENIDNDFCFICLSERIITTGGGFSKLVRELNEIHKSRQIEKKV
jgi:hypothetical protein